MQVEIGAVVEAKVTGITEYGAFVEFDGGKSGMIHISEVASGFVKDINEHLKVGQVIKAKIISVNPQGKISLSAKDAGNNSEPSDAEKPPFSKPSKPVRSEPRVWKGKPAPVSGEKQSFEDMMASFKKASEEKMSALKKYDSRRGSTGYSRRGKN